MARLLESDDSHIVCAFDGSILAGYAVILRFDASDGRRVAWIAQLVIAATYRHSRVATTMMFSAWHFSDYQVWGIVTANPYAVRALETATRRPCRAKLIVDEAGSVIADLRSYLAYLPENLDGDGDGPRPSVDTQFHLDLSEMEKMREGAARPDRPWSLGSIPEGHEWFAATFSSQAPTVARGEYLRELLDGVDSIWIRAYEGMTLDSDHAWHRHGDAEVDWITERLDLEPGTRVVDGGCGDGRHAVAMALRGFDVTGLDISERLIDKAWARAAAADVPVEFACADLREPSVVERGPFDVAVCLYDVVGSSADPTDDRTILANIRAMLRPGGYLVLSVMSAHGTFPFLSEQNRPSSQEEFVSALERLAPSRQMESSGSVFNPEYIVYYDGSFYRKEQFDLADDLPPAELIIRDRRFTVRELVELLDGAGFSIMEISGMRAGRWTEPLAPDAPEAREILVVARIA